MCPTANPTRRDFLRRTGALGVSAGLLGAISPGNALAGVSASARPNIVYIFSDQQHGAALGCVDPFFETPNLDHFAGDAVRFDRAFCSTPQCSPSRSSMMTGLYPSKTGVMGNVGAAGGNPLRQETIGKMLRDVGYDTAYFGKWHLGNDPKGKAGWDQGFFKQKDPEAARRSVEFLRSRANQGKPFALFASFLDPHDIYQFNPDRFPTPDPGTSLPPSWEREDFSTKPKVHREFMERDQGARLHGRPRETWEAYREFYRGKVRKVDSFIGRVFDAIKSAGKWDNTIVVFASDHGDMDAHHRLVFKGPFMYDQMIRIPFLVRVPDRFGGVDRGRAVSDYDVVNVDLVPSIRDFAGLSAVPTDGISLRPFLTGATDPPKRDFVICQYYSKQKWVNPIRTIRTAEFKYNRYIDHGEELYDLKDDPHEIVNRANDSALAATKKSLRADLDRWIAKNDDPFYTLKTTPLVRKRRERS